MPEILQHDVGEVHATVSLTLRKECVAQALLEDVDIYDFLLSAVRRGWT